MTFANLEMTNLLLVLLMLVSAAQFILLVTVILSLKASAARAKTAMSVLVGDDLHQMHRRFTHLLNDVETLVARGNTVLGAVERGAQDFGAAASLVGHKAQKALALGSFEVQAAATVIKTGLNILKQFFPWRSSGNGHPNVTTAARFGSRTP